MSVPFDPLFQPPPGTDRIQGLPPVEAFIRQTLELFQDPNGIPFENPPKVAPSDQLRNEAAIRTILEDLADALAPWRGSAPDQLTEEDLAGLEEIIKEHLIRLDEGRHLFDEPFLSFFIERGYLDAARSFLFQARIQDPTLSYEEIFQAMRNVWIMNSLQLMWDIPLAVTPPVYAYSMLYPYTDNYLDDPAVSPADKHAFNRLIREALDGASPDPGHPASRRVLELIAMIRSHYDAASRPRVFESIRLIQTAQTASMAQDQTEHLVRPELLRLSFFKGGASVLADGFLVKGSLTAAEMTFAFLYGSFLQLVDDLQDARADLEEGHQTLFSNQLPGQALDESIRQLLVFIQRINAPADEDPPQVLQMKQIIGACSQLMVLEVVGRDPALISTRFYNDLQMTCKVRLGFFQEMNELLQRMGSALDFQAPLTVPGHLPG